MVYYSLSIYALKIALLLNFSITILTTYSLKYEIFYQNLFYKFIVYYAFQNVYILSDLFDLDLYLSNAPFRGHFLCVYYVINYLCFRKCVLDFSVIISYINHIIAADIKPLCYVLVINSVIYYNMPYLIRFFL